MTILNRLRNIVGEYHVFEEQEGGKYGSDWTHSYVFKPLAIVRPADTNQVSEVVKLANEEKNCHCSHGWKHGACGWNVCPRGISDIPRASECHSRSA